MNNNELIGLLYERHSRRPSRLPDKQMCADFIESVFAFLFDGTPQSGRDGLQQEYGKLSGTLSALLFDVLYQEAEAEEHTRLWQEALPEIYSRLLQDAEAIVAFDPAARSVEEVLMAYPGFFATAVYRLSHQLQRQGVPVLPRLFSEYAHSKTGIDIHPGAVIGKAFFVDHGTGIVIGESTRIGDRVKIYQGVTIGALNVAKELASTKRHPTIEDDVIIYSGATILGGATVVGHDSVIGGNVWLTQSVAPYAVVYQKSEIVIRDKFPLAEPLNFII